MPYANLSKTKKQLSQFIHNLSQPGSGDVLEIILWVGHASHVHAVTTLVEASALTLRRARRNFERCVSKAGREIIP